MVKLFSLCLALVLSFTILMPPTAIAASTPPLLDSTQQTLVLSFLSNAISGVEGEPEDLTQKLTDKINLVFADPTMQSYLGKWELVWGPAIYQLASDQSALDELANDYPMLADRLSELKYADDAMYVARQNNRYVVAIAGTNDESLYSWLFQNFDVKSNRQVPWPYGNPLENLDPKISGGTNEGLQNLLGMTSSGQSLLEFLGTIVADGNNPEIIFTGHSLGGALSPTLALAVFDRSSEWAKGNDFSIFVEPSAGPTPGNNDFSKYYGDRLGESTKRIWNDLDIVPHAWNQKMLNQIPNIYDEIQPSQVIICLVRIAQRRASGGKYVQLLPEEESLEGEFSDSANICLSGYHLGDSVDRPSLLEQNVKSLKFCSESDLPEQDVEFLQQSLYQHTEAYAVLLDLVDPYCYLNELIMN
ncbi:MAG: hypothetical protein J7647_09095 [Cyanobacteria bacterium SBLK]|nr:hypothetical protein [Cyanobacteria bacterium SBLK]